jgi:hypothetical protein
VEVLPLLVVKHATLDRGRGWRVPLTAALDHPERLPPKPPLPVPLQICVHPPSVVNMLQTQRILT